MGLTRAALTALVVAAVSGGIARADDSYRAVIDRVDLEPAAIGGLRLRVYLSAVAVQGQLLDLSEPKSIKAIVGGSELKAPYALGAYGGTTAETAIVFVVESTAAYADVLPVISDALDASLMTSLPDKSTQIALLSYGDAIGTGKLTSVKVARGKLAQLASDASTEDPALLETVERALILLKKAKVDRDGRPLREMIVVIGDGRDRSGDRDRVIRVAKRAASAGVRIHTLGFSPTDTRRPLLLLGELSKRSLGTFRWVRGAKADSLDGGGTATPRRDLAPGRRDVLPRRGRRRHRQEAEDPDRRAHRDHVERDRDPEGDHVRRLGVRHRLLRRDHCVAPAERGAGDGILGLILKIVGGAVALLFLLVGIGFVLSKRAARVPSPVQAPGILPPACTASARRRRPSGRPRSRPQVHHP